MLIYHKFSFFVLQYAKYPDKKRRSQNRRCRHYAMGWTIQCLNPNRGKSLSVLWNVQTRSGANPVSCSVGTWFLSRGKSSWGMKLTTHFCLVLRLRMSGDVPSVQQKSSGLKFSKSRTGNHVTYSCHHNSSRFTFPVVVHSWLFSVFHSLQSVTPHIY